jgi:hypothetical protein
MTDPQQRAIVGVQVASQWAANDPVAAATWAAQMDQQDPPDPNNPLSGSQLLASAIRSWATYDIDAPGQFLNNLPASPAKDGSVAIFAMQAGQEDPQSAMQWIGTITNPQMKQGVTMGVALQWMQQDPAGFNQYLSTTTTIDDQTKQQLASIPPGVLQSMNMMNSAGGGGNGNFIQNMMENAIINGRGMMGGRGGRAFGGQGGGGPPGSPSGGN